MADFLPITPTPLVPGSTPQQDIYVPSVANPSQYSNNTPTPAPVSGADLFGQLASQSKAKDIISPLSYNAQDALKYSDYNASLDNEEIYAQTQSAGKQFLNAVAKTGITAGTTFLQGLMSIPDQIRGLSGGNVYQNSWAASLDKFKENSEIWFPNYYSKWQQDHPALSAIPFSGGSANFWFDKVLKNTGFTIGAIGSALAQDTVIGAVTGGLGDIPAIGNQVGKAALWLNKVFTGTNDLEQVLNGARVAGATEDALLSIKQMGQLAAATKVKNGAEYMANLYTSAHAEAAIEARDGYNKVKDDLSKDYRDKTGYNPTGDDLAEIENTATQSGNVRYGINMGLLTLSNAIQFDNFLKPFSSVKHEIGELTAKGINNVDKVAFKDIEGIGNKIWSVVKPHIPNILSEGIYEEGGQYAAETGTANYFENKYKNKTKGDLDEVIKSSLYGLGQEFGTGEGRENIILGSITGFLGHYVGKAKEKVKELRGKETEDSRTQAVIDSLNQRGITGIFQDHYDNTANSLKSKDDIQKAVSSADVFKFKNLKDDSFYNFISSGVKAGRFDVRIEQLKLLKDLNVEEMRKVFNMPEGDREDLVAYTDVLINKAQEIKKSYDTISNTLVNPFKYNKDTSIEEKASYVAFENYKEELGLHSYREKAFTSRLSDIQKSIDPGISLDLLDQLSSGKRLQELSKEYEQQAKNLEDNYNESLNKKEDKKTITNFKTLSQDIIDFLNTTTHNPDQQTKLFSNLINFETSGRTIGETPIAKETIPGLINMGFDVRRINTARQIAAKTYDNLYSSKGLETYLKQYEEWRNQLAEPTKEELTVLVPQTPSGFALDREYKKKGKSSYTIINQNDNGTIRVRNSKGEVVDIQPKDLQGYSIVKTPAEIGLEQRAELLKDKKRTQNLIDAQNILNQTTIPTPEFVSEEDKNNQLTTINNTQDEEGKKVDPNILLDTSANSSEDWNTITDNFEKRAKTFLQNFDDIDTSNLQVANVTLNSEEAIGLKGLTEAKFPSTITMSEQQRIDEGLVSAVLMRGNSFIDINGKEIKKNDPNLLDKVVVFARRKADLKWADNQSSQRNALTEEQKNQQLANWKQRRTQYFNNKTPDYQTLVGVSRGIPVYNKIEGQKQYKETGVIGTLLPKNKENILTNTQVVKVSIGGSISSQGRSYPIPAGWPVFSYKSKLVPLSNKLFSSKEVDNIFDSLHNLSKERGGHLDKTILSYLNSILYWGEKGKVNIDGSRNLNLYGLSIPFNVNSILANEVQIKEVLSKTYNSINNSLLSDISQSFQEIKSYNEDGSINKAKQWPNYQTYLLSSEGRTAEEIPLRTVIKPLSEEPNFKQKYAIFQSPEGQPEIVTPKVEKVATPDLPATTIAEDNTINNFITKSGDIIQYTYEIDSDGDPLITILDTPENKAIIEAINFGGDKYELVQFKIQEQISSQNSAPIVNEPQAPTTITEPSHDTFDDADGPSVTQYRVVGEGEEDYMTSEYYQEFKDWLQKNLPQFTSQDIETILSRPDGRQVWGKIENGIITLYKSSPKGVPYHEAFHGVFTNLLSSDQQKELTEEFRSRVGTYLDIESGKTINYSQATDSQAEEKMADEFGEFKKGKLSGNSISDKILNFFKKIIKWAKAFIFGSKETETKLFQLFDNINKGKFSNAPIKGHIDAQYRIIDNLTEKQTHEFVQDIVARVMINLVTNNKDLFDPQNYNAPEVLNSIKEQYKVEKQNKKTGLSKYDYLGESGYNKLLQKAKEFLNTLNVKIDIDNQISINEEGSTRNDYVKDAFKESPKKSAPFATKSIIGSLPKTKAGGDIELSSVKGFQLIPFNQAFITLMKNLQGASNPMQLFEAITKLADTNSDYIRLFNRMKGSTDNNGRVFNFDNLSTSDWRLVTSMFSTFMKQAPETFNQYMKEGETYQSSANLAKPIDRQIQEWESSILNSIKQEDSIYKRNDNKTYSVDKDKIKDLPVANVDNQIKFLETIGIAFPKETYNKLSSEDKDKFSDTISIMKGIILKTDNIISPNRKTLNIKGSINTLAGLAVKVNSLNEDSIFIGVKGQQKQIYVNHNRASLFTNQFNSVDNLDQLKAEYPYYNDVFATNSLLFKKGGQFFDEEGNRTPTKLSIGYIDGNIDTNSGKNKELSQLNQAERLITEINANLRGWFYTIIPADGSTEWMLNLGQHISYTDLSNNDGMDKVHTIFTNYLKDEISLANQSNRTVNKTNNSKELRFFKDILSEGLQKKLLSRETIEDNQEEINTHIDNWISERVKETKENLLSKGLLYRLQDSYVLKNLDSNYSNKNNINPNNLSEEELNRLLQVLDINSAINLTEMHKVLFGDPYQYKIKDNLDETKRIKSYLSPRETTFASEEYNAYANTTLNTVEGIELSKGTPGFHQFRDYMRTSTTTIGNGSEDIIGSLVMEDLPPSIVDAAKKVTEADASSVMGLSTYRDAKTRLSQWTPLAEQWYQWNMAQARLNSPYEFEYPKALKDHDIALTKTSEPSFVMEVLKPIVSGPKALKQDLDNILDKMSQIPLSWSIAKGRSLENLFFKMIKEDIDYIVMPSGRKQGMEGTHDLYSKDGQFNTEPFNSTSIVNIGWNTWGKQVENSFEEKQQTRGSQITKVITLDLFDQGNATDQVKNITNRNNEVLNELTKLGYSNLLNKLGITDNGDSFSYSIDNYKLAELLQSEMLKRDMEDNAKDAIKLDPDTGEFLLPFEATTNYKKIQDIIYSMADKALVSPKYSGSPHVQVSALLWEDKALGRDLVIKEGNSYKRITREEYNNLSTNQQAHVRFTSSNLKWYTKNEPWMEVLMPHWFKGQLQQSKKLKNYTDYQLIQYLSTPEGSKILTGIGFRIPTQGLNSIEVFKVKGFLPQSAGHTIVVPSEITTKAGSDFDIDKLNIYLKNTYIDSKGDLQVVPFYGIYEAAKEKLKVLQASIDISKEKGVKDIIEEYDPNEFIEEFSSDKLYQQSLENEYFNTLQEMVQLPENFERLLTPNTDEDVKALSIEIGDKLGEKETTKVSNLLNRNFLSYLRHAFLTGKKWVGIAAVNITGHALSQREDIYIDPTNFEGFSDYDKQFVDPDNERLISILLPHNVNTNGYPSFSHKLNKEEQYISDIQTQNHE